MKDGLLILDYRVVFKILILNIERLHKKYVFLKTAVSGGWHEINNSNHQAL